MDGIDTISLHLANLRLRQCREDTTIKQRASVLRRLQRALGGGDPVNATPADLLAWQESLAGLSPQTHNTYVSHLRGYYQWAIRAELRTTDPTTRLVRPRLPRRLPRPIPEDKLVAAIAAADGRVRLWLVLAAWGGLRARELATLHRSHLLLDADPPVLLVADGKGGHQRTVPLAPVILAELRDYPSPPGRGGWLFPRADGRRGEHITPARVSAMCNAHLRALGISDTLHSLRHRFGTELYHAAPDLRMVQEIMGHASPTTTAGYVAYNREAAGRAVLAMRGAM